MKITQAFLTNRKASKLVPKGVVIHYVGNPKSSAMANRNYFNGPSANGASAHYIVGLNGEIIQCVPENERAGHAGVSYAAKYNEQAKLNNGMYLGIENCHPDASGKFAPATYEALVLLVTDICVRYGFDVETDVIRHYDCTGKACPLYYVRNEGEWRKLKDRVYACVLIARCRKHNVIFDPDYWNRVVNGEIFADATFLSIIAERLGGRK